MNQDQASAIEGHIPSLRRYARSLTGSIDRADDLVQDCLERAVARFQQFQPGTDLRAWLFTILHNVHCDQARRRARRGTHVPLEDCDHLLRLPARQGDNLEVRDLRRAFASLSDDHRRILLLAAVEGFSCEECASILGVAVGTVKSRLSRARENLRTAHLKDAPVAAPAPAEASPSTRAA
jgi:RNA polymerase sigma-70 factor, ECF subfamily